ncbi:uncharacterized protein LOC132395342 isoform X3 [Hypanus sabinus]|uniref:uncharacterized protein LOC132395342 isoform X3 n=1 Tax=Hypanus sabinus TaxID=79690 RepID=UPI0028C42314|nr:uncharacterized protein LOC132395342 isoform X3 [Hypanus sabinus]
MIPCGRGRRNRPMLSSVQQLQISWCLPKFYQPVNFATRGNSWSLQGYPPSSPRILRPCVIKHARRDLFNPPIKTVSVNCSVDRPPALEEDLPVNNIMLAFPNKDYIRDSETPWHIHLDIHRMLLAQKTGQKSQVEADERSDVQSPQLPVVSRGTSDGGDTSDDDQKSNGDATAVSSCKANELKETFHSLYRYNHHIPQINKRFSFPNERSNIWASKNGHVTRISPITKGDYYPFPHMKTPRKSDTAKGLGLYNKY